MVNCLWGQVGDCWGLCPKIQFMDMSQIIKLFNYIRLFISELMGHYHNPWDALNEIYVI